MNFGSSDGARLRAGRGGRGTIILFAAAALACAAGSASAGSSIEFNGELDYEAFEAANRGDRSLRITYSPGGTGAAAMVLARSKGLVIDGVCNSACAWAFIQNENACFTERASFGFHAAHDPGTGQRLLAATQYWLSTVKASLRSRLDDLQKTSQLINISASTMKTYYGERLCGRSKRADKN